jgi:hypothetical protein
MLISFLQAIVRLRAIWLMLLVSLYLSGCVEYDVGIHFAHQAQGEIVQHVHIGEQLTSFSDTVAQDWLQSIKQRTRQMGGRVRQTSRQELVVTIPFNNGADLTQKFNEFFQFASQPVDRNLQSDLPELRSELALTQSNWLLVERDRLIYDLDLRPLGLISTKGNLLVSPGSLLDLSFRLNAPWGVRNVTPASSSSPEVQNQGKQLVWMLKPGVVNHLEATFWVPSPLGIGTVAIVLLVIGGIYLKSQLFSDPLAESESLGGV